MRKNASIKAKFWRIIHLIKLKFPSLLKHHLELNFIEKLMVKEVIETFDKTDHLLCIYSIKDQHFIAAVPFFHKYKCGLDYLCTYGYACERYCEEIEKKGVSFEIEKAIIDYSKGGYSNLIYYFNKNHIWSPEAIKLLKQQKYFKFLNITY